MAKHIEKNIGVRETISPFIADTWWYGMSKRMSEENFLKLVKKRKQQGFNAAQIVVGIPPEVGCYNENAKSIEGGAWDLKGKINYDYLKFARNRIKIMNKYGIKAIIYGAWGHQIEWIGQRGISKWWKCILEYFDDLDVIYCLTGESDLWTYPKLGKKLLPDKTTKNMFTENSFLNKILRKINNLFKLSHNGKKMALKRKQKWSNILKYVFYNTQKAIIIHTTPNISGFQAVENSEMLSANTFQTGHNIESENNIWKFPMISKEMYPNKMVVNLEPWYEGIFDSFYDNYQLKACWLSIAGGATSICYGAHGIWNVGDEKFLSQWGKQTFSQALELRTPLILGKTFSLLKQMGIFEWNKVEILKNGEQLISLTRSSKDGKKMTYIPEINRCNTIPYGEILDINKVEYTKLLPKSGQVVIFH